MAGGGPASSTAPQAGAPSLSLHPPNSPRDHLVTQLGGDHPITGPDCRWSPLGQGKGEKARGEKSQDLIYK